MPVLVVDDIAIAVAAAISLSYSAHEYSLCVASHLAEFLVLRGVC